MPVLKKHRLWAYVTANDVERLEKLCVKWSTDRSTVIRTLIREGLEREERVRPNSKPDYPTGKGRAPHPYYYISDEQECRDRTA